MDLHGITFDAEGERIQRLQDGSTRRYPPEGFLGHGRVDGQEVACLSPEVQVLCHLGYEPDETNRRDIQALAEVLALPLPVPYGPGST